MLHIKQLVRQHSHQIFSSLVLHLLRGRREGEPSRLQSDSRSSVHAARILLNPRPPASAHIESSALAVSPTDFTPRWQMPLQTLPPSFFSSIRTKATPPPTSPWGLFVTVEEPFSLFVLRAFPGLFSVDIHTICQQQRKVHTNLTGSEASRSEVSAGSRPSSRHCTCR